jgi:peptidoglycan/LPS O-acetylase OafA/YrhL
LREAVRALLYWTNWARAYNIGRSDHLAHTWSLSIEEQFYMVWPALLIVLLRFCARRSILSWVILGATFSWLARIFLNYVNPYTSPNRLLCGLDTRADALLLGCAVALYLSNRTIVKPNSSDPSLRILSGGSVLGLSVMGVLAWTNASWMIYAGWTLVSVLSAVIILELVVSRRWFLHRLLENELLVYLGKISYGLYLWHYPIMRVFEKYHHHWPWGKWAMLPTVFAVTLISYYVIELPCLRLKKKYQRVPER